MDNHLDRKERIKKETTVLSLFNVTLYFLPLCVCVSPSLVVTLSRKPLALFSLPSYMLSLSRILSAVSSLSLCFVFVKKSNKKRIEGVPSDIAMNKIAVYPECSLASSSFTKRPSCAPRFVLRISTIRIKVVFERSSSTKLAWMSGSVIVLLSAVLIKVEQVEERYYFS